jgi:hypothetical protein
VDADRLADDFGQRALGAEQIVVYAAGADLIARQDAILKSPIQCLGVAERASRVPIRLPPRPMTGKCYAGISVSTTLAGRQASITT